MWHKLSGLYERKNALNKASLMRKIVRLKYKGGESIVVPINNFMGLVNQLAAAKFPLDDTLQALLLLCTLPHSWENLVVSLSASRREENLSLQVIKTRILNKETRRTRVFCPSQKQMFLLSRSKHRSPQRIHKSHARSKSRGKITGFHCGKPGHFQKDCRNLRNTEVL